jgi:hypothetical protein
MSFYVFDRVLFFSKNWALVSLRVRVENLNSPKLCFNYGNVLLPFSKINKTRFGKWSNHKNIVSISFIFRPSPWGEPGVNFSKKIKLDQKHKNSYKYTQFFTLIQNIILLSMKILTFPIEMGQILHKKLEVYDFSVVFIADFLYVHFFFEIFLYNFVALQKGCQMR